jgi:predicted kinase
MRTFILLSAIPGAGKSTWAKQYKETHPNTYIVSSDEIRKERFGAVNNFQHEKEVWEIFLSTINNYADTMKDVTVIGDATNLENRFREYYCKNTPHFEKHILVLFDVPYEICLIQNTMRTSDRIVPLQAMEHLRSQLEFPSPEVLKMYDQYILVKSFSKKVKVTDERPVDAGDSCPKE